MGMWQAKQRYGNPDVSWSSLIQPSIDMARNGIELGFTMAKYLQESSEYIKEDPGLRQVSYGRNVLRLV